MFFFRLLYEVFDAFSATGQFERVFFLLHDYFVLLQFFTVLCRYNLVKLRLISFAKYGPRNQDMKFHKNDKLKTK